MNFGRTYCSWIALAFFIILSSSVSRISCVWNCPDGINANAEPVFEDVKLELEQSSQTVWTPRDLDKQPWKQNVTCPDGEYLRKLSVNEEGGLIKFTIECGNVTREGIGAPDDLKPVDRPQARDKDKKPACRGPMIGFLMQWNRDGQVIRLQMECAGGEFATVYEKEGPGAPRRQYRKKCLKGTAICGYTDFYNTGFPSVDWFNPLCCPLPPELSNVTESRTATMPGGDVVEIIGPAFEEDHKSFKTVYCPLPHRFPVQIHGETFVDNKFQEFAMPCNQNASDYNPERDCAWSIVGFSYKRKRKDSGAMADIQYECDSGAWREVANPFGMSTTTTGGGESKRYKFRCSEKKAVCGFIRDGPNNALNLVCCPLPDDVNWETCQAVSYFERVFDASQISLGIADDGDDEKLEYDQIMIEERSSLYGKRVMQNVEEALRARGFYPDGLANVSLKFSTSPREISGGEGEQIHQLRVKCGPYEFRFGKLIRFTDLARPSCTKFAELGVYYCRCLPLEERPKSEDCLPLQLKRSPKSCESLPPANRPKGCKRHVHYRLIANLDEYDHTKTYEIGIINTPPGLRDKLYDWNSWSQYDETHGLLETVEIDACKYGVSIRHTNLRRATIRDEDLFRRKGMDNCIYQLFVKCGQTEVNFKVFKRAPKEGGRCFPAKELFTDDRISRTT